MVMIFLWITKKRPRSILFISIIVDGTAVFELTHLRFSSSSRISWHERQKINTSRSSLSCASYFIQMIDNEQRMVIVSFPSLVHWYSEQIESKRLVENISTNICLTPIVFPRQSSRSLLHSSRHPDWIVGRDSPAPVQRLVSALTQEKHFSQWR